MGYTWVHLGVAGDVQSQYLSNVARHLVSGNVSLTHRRFTLSVGGLYKVRAAQQTTPSATTNFAELTHPSYAVFNARLELALLPERRVAGGPGPKFVQRPLLRPAGRADAHPLAHGRRARGVEAVGGVVKS